MNTHPSERAMVRPVPQGGARIQIPVLSALPARPLPEQLDNGLGLRYADGVTTVTLATPEGRESFTLDGDVTRDNFIPVAEPRGVPPKDEPLCFVEGTRILTTAGEVPVERLQIGDVAILQDGGEAAILFIGQRHLDLAQHPRRDAMLPVRIQAGALEDDIPSRDLMLSPDHAVYLGGALVPARNLIDGLRIRQERGAKWVRYYHVELAAHGVLIAEGAAAESFLDTGQRGLFDNAGTPAKEPAGTNRAELSCAALVTNGPELAAIRSRLYARALMRGYTVKNRQIACLKAGKELLTPLTGADNLIVFRLPPGIHRATLLSPVFRPAETDPTSTDRRVLGLAIAEMALDGKFIEPEKIFNKADLHGRGIREAAQWTRGAARLNVPPGTQEISLRITGWPKVWRSG